MNDLIFRSDAINAIKARFGNAMVIEEATKALEGVPEVECTCAGCIYNDGESHAICERCVRICRLLYEGEDKVIK